MTRLSIEPISEAFAGLVRDADLADLDPDAWHAISAAFATYAVLVFPRAGIGTEQQDAFGARFGPLELINGRQGAVRVGNVRGDGTQVTDDSNKLQYGLVKGNEGWHTDSSYMPVSARASLLSAHIVPASGSATEWADMRGAYDALPDAIQQRVTGLSAYHSYKESQRRLGFPIPEDTYGFDVDEPPLRPLVKIHPDTGRRSLFVGRHAYGIPGLSAEDSAELLNWLNEFACAPPWIFRHEWSVGDLVLWDNRCVLHRATPWNLAEPRLMMHTRIAGDPRTEGVSPA